MRLAALGAGMGSVNVSVLDPGAPFDDLFGRGVGFREQGLGGKGLDELDFDDHDGQRPRGGRTPVGAPLSVPRARILPALLDVAFAGPPINCEPTQCAVLEEMFEWQKLRHYTNAVLDKYVIGVSARRALCTFTPFLLCSSMIKADATQVDGNGWSSRFKRLMNSGSLIFKATTYPEWYVPLPPLIPLLPPSLTPRLSVFPSSHAPYACSHHRPPFPISTFIQVFAY